MQSVSKGVNGMVLGKTHSTDSVNILRSLEAPKYVMVNFYGLGNFIG